MMTDDDLAIFLYEEGKKSPHRFVAVKLVQARIGETFNEVINRAIHHGLIASGSPVGSIRLSDAGIEHAEELTGD